MNHSNDNYGGLEEFLLCKAEEIISRIADKESGAIPLLNFAAQAKQNNLKTLP